MLTKMRFGLGLLLLSAATTFAQAPPPGVEPGAVDPASPVTSEPIEPAAPTAEAKAEDAIGAAKERVEEFAEQVDKSQQAKEITAGILDPIYKIAEQLSFPMFHWLAFAIMATGVVSYTLQLVLAKLVVLTKAGFSPSEILSDALGLVISVVGLVLTTQASAENSTFTQSPASVLSAAAVGVIAGFIFYRWGQAQEVQATMARSVAAGVVSQKMKK